MKLEHFFTYFKPENYNLTLKINRLERSFAGKVLLTGQTKTSDKVIKLHANYLTIESVKIDDQTVDFKYQDNVLSFFKPNWRTD